MVWAREFCFAFGVVVATAVFVFFHLFLLSYLFMKKKLPQLRICCRLLLFFFL